jgi:hypothetical protein
MTPIFDFTDKPKQAAFFYDRSSQTIGGGGGYNSGKSFAMIGKIHYLLTIFPGSLAIIGRKTYGALEKSIIPTYESIAKKQNGGNWVGQFISKFADMTAHYRNGSRLWFVTYDDVKKVRGPNIAFAGISQAEEVAHEIFLELKGRCRQWNPESIAEFKARYGESLKEQLGFVPEPFNQLICEFNPAPNWVRKEFIFNESGSNKYYDLPTHENKKYHAKGWLDSLKKSYSAEWYNRFVLGSWDSFGGAVYPEFDYEGLHGVQPFKIPNHWPRFVGGDYGYRNPAAFECITFDEDGNEIVFLEYYKDLVPIKDHVRWIYDQLDEYRLPVGEMEKPIVHMDYEIKGDIDKEGKNLWDHYRDEGLFLIEAEKSVMAGIQLIKQRLLPDPEHRFPAWHPRAGELGSPRLFIMRGRCPNLVNEFQTYIWEPQEEGKEKNYVEKPKKWNDHALDSFRYATMAANKAFADRLPDLSAEAQARRLAQRLAQHAFTRAVPLEDEDDE